MGRILVFVLFFILVSCAKHPSTDSVSVRVSVVPPAQLNSDMTSRNLVPSLWSVSVLIGEREISMQPSADFSIWESDTVSLSESISMLEVVWRYDNVLAADYSGVLDTSVTGGRLQLGPEDYRSFGDGFDVDGDGLTNLMEILSGFDPLNDQQPKSETVGVFIPYINPEQSPVIDGIFDTGVWSSGAMKDWNEEYLRIDNLMVDQGADRPNGQTEFNWSALHDGEYLYLIVFGESTDIATLQSDSFNLWRDDNLHLVIDGDNSKQQSYDGENDYNWLIPLLDIVKPASPYTDIAMEVDENNDIIRNTAGEIAILLNGVRTFVPPGELVANTTIGETAPNRYATSAGVPENEVDIEFANCLCTSGQHIWELKIKLIDVDIRTGRAFGLEVQIDDDIQGGDREARYGWYHPAREFNTDTDNSWFNPSFTGTAILLPPQQM